MPLIGVRIYHLRWSVWPMRLKTRCRIGKPVIPAIEPKAIARARACYFDQAGEVVVLRSFQLEKLRLLAIFNNNLDFAPAGSPNAEVNTTLRHYLCPDVHPAINTFILHISIAVVNSFAAPVRQMIAIASGK